MTYEELKNKFEELTQMSLNLKDEGDYMILEESGIELMAFNKYAEYERHFRINTTSIHPLLNLYYKDNYKTMWDIIFSLIDTPADERFTEQKYYVKLDLPEKFSNKQQYLNKMVMNDGIVRYLWDEKKKKPSTYISPLELGVIYQTQFTVEEIEEIIPKEDMDKFKLIPVEEVK